MKKLSILAFCMITIFAAAAVRAQTSDALNSDPPKEDAESMELFKEATALYLDHEYKASIPIYEKALALEKKKRTMERKWWIVLVDNLSIAYGITGDIKSSRSVIEYGISREPTYPLFYYNNACGYAEENDEVNAIKNLRLAFKYKANMLESETLPDPATDDSFKELMKSEKFKKALAEMKAAK